MFRKQVNSLTKRQLSCEDPCINLLPEILSLKIVFIKNPGPNSAMPLVARADRYHSNLLHLPTVIKLLKIDACFIVMNSLQ